jgi:hypothetical protein
VVLNNISIQLDIEGSNESFFSELDVEYGMDGIFTEEVKFDFYVLELIFTAAFFFCSVGATVFFFFGSFSFMSATCSTVLHGFGMIVTRSGRCSEKRQRDLIVITKARDCHNTNTSYHEEHS